MYTPPHLPWHTRVEAVLNHLDLSPVLRGELEELYASYLRPDTLSPMLEKTLLGPLLFEVAWTARQRGMDLARARLEVLILLTQTGCALRRLEQAGVLRSRFSGVLWLVFTHLSGVRAPLERHLALKRMRA